MSKRLPVPDPGQLFGRLTVLSQEITVIDRKRAVPCRCECGEERLARIGDLLGGHVKSCGKCGRGAQFANWINSPENAERLRKLHNDPAFKAKRAENNRSPQYVAKQREAKLSHGMSRHQLYGTWTNMVNRCTNQQARDYARYGGRGIKVHARWLDVRVFIEDIERDLGPRPDGCSLDRIDNDGGYEPGNVRWATFSVQMANRRRAARLADRQWRTILAALSESSSPEIQDALAALSAQLKAILQGNLSRDYACAVLGVYFRAWETRDADLVCTIFTEGAIYHEGPLAKAIPDREAIRDYWRTKVARDQANIKCQLLTFYVDGETVVGEWEARFDDLVQGVRKRMRGVVLLEFDGTHVRDLRQYLASETIGELQGTRRH